jgi:hypothetical protein
VVALDLGIYDWLATTLAGGSLDLRRQLQIDRHLYTNTD